MKRVGTRKVSSPILILRRPQPYPYSANQLAPYYASRYFGNTPLRKKDLHKCTCYDPFSSCGWLGFQSCRLIHFLVPTMTRRIRQGTYQESRDRIDTTKECSRGMIGEGFKGWEGIDGTPKSN